MKSASRSRSISGTTAAASTCQWSSQPKSTCGESNTSVFEKVGRAEDDDVVEEITGDPGAEGGGVRKP